MTTLVDRLRAFIRDDYAVARPNTKALFLEAADRIERLERALEFISTADTGGEIFPSGPSDTEYAEDGNTVVRHVPPWMFLTGRGPTFLEAVESAMEQRPS